MLTTMDSKCTPSPPISRHYLFLPLIVPSGLILNQFWITDECLIIAFSPTDRKSKLRTWVVHVLL